MLDRTCAPLLFDSNAESAPGVLREYGQMYSNHGRGPEKRLKEQSWLSKLYTCLGRGPANRPAAMNTYNYTELELELEL